MRAFTAAEMAKITRPGFAAPAPLGSASRARKTHKEEGTRPTRGGGGREDAAVDRGYAR